MKQIVQDLQGKGARVVEVPIPAVGSGQILIRTAFSLLSAGTERSVSEFAAKSLAGKAMARPDLVRQTVDKARREGVLAAADAVRTRLAEPMALGYASSGIVVEVGKDVDDFRPGDRVACAGGGYAVHAEFAVVPGLLATRLPDSVGLEAGAFVTLGAIALHGVRLGEIKVGERVGVIGLGIVGLLAAAIARGAGAEVFAVDLDPGRVEVAKGYQAHGYLRDGAAVAIWEATAGRGVDVVLICADTESSDPVELAADIARDRAKIVAVGAVGMQIPRKRYYEKELEFLVSRSYGPGRYDPSYEEAGRDYPIGYVRWTEGRNLQAVAEMMGRGDLDVAALITHKVPVEKGDEAYGLLQGSALGVLIDYGSADAAIPMEGRVATFRSAPREPGPIRIGVLGAGRFAQGTVLPMLRKQRGLDLVGVASRGGLSAAETARTFGFQYATTESERILQDPGINTVAVLTRHDLHAGQTSGALSAGKHVWCEKPLAIDREGLSQVVRAAQSSPGLLTVGFNRRRAPLAMRLREFLAGSAGGLSMIYRVNAGPLPDRHWLLDPRQGGGRLLGEVCHFIDFLTYLAESPVRRVRTTAGRAGDLVVVLEFGSGAVGTILYSVHGDRAFGKERVEAFGPERVAVLDDFRRLEMVTGGHRRSARLWLRSDKGHAALWSAFLGAIATGGLPPIPYTDLFSVTEATLAAAESLQTGAAIELGPAPHPG
jgi:predicted dehydrogenase